ncbi:hypothetical protein CRENBAI_019444 [Crenichthys baileyi]|uniref:Uncharacterized protein n=1 Tax=Crenichthys baileyi TaxID=28760 RepID=A0AAV9S3X2_9TELE
MARGCICCVKYMLFLFNLFFWLGGCGLLGVGIWLSVSQGSFATLSPSFPSLSAANLIITLGTVVMVTGFFGCLGAIKENKCLLLSGCYDKVEQWVDENKHLLGTIAMCVLVIQLLGMAFSMTLYQQIHRAGKKYQA